MTEPGKAPASRQQFVRFILVGLGNTAIGYLLFAGFVQLGVPSQPALALAFTLGVIWNFWAHARFVFGQGGFAKLPAYVGVYLAIWAGNALALKGAEGIGLPPLIAQALLAPIAAVLSFVFIARVLTGAYPFLGKATE